MNILQAGKNVIILRQKLREFLKHNEKKNLRGESSSQTVVRRKVWQESPQRIEGDKRIYDMVEHSGKM